MYDFKKICTISASKEEIDLIKYNGILYLEISDYDIPIWKNLLINDEVIFFSKDLCEVIKTSVIDKYIFIPETPNEIVRSPLVIKFHILEFGQRLRLNEFYLLKRFEIIDEKKRNVIFGYKEKRNINNIRKETSLDKIIYQEDAYKVFLAKTSNDFNFIYNLSQYHSFGLKKALFSFICEHHGKRVGAVVFDIGNNNAKNHFLALKIFRSRYDDLRKYGIFIHRLYNDISVEKKIKLHEVLINSTIKIGMSILKENLTFVEGVSYDYHPVAEKLQFNIEIPDNINDSFYFWKPFHHSLISYQNLDYNFIKKKVHEIIKERDLYKFSLVIGSSVNIKEGIRQRMWALNKNKNNSGRWHNLSEDHIVFFYAKDTEAIVAYGFVKNTRTGTIGKFTKYELIIEFSTIVSSVNFKINQNDFEKIYNSHHGGIIPLSNKIGLFFKTNIDNNKNILNMWVNPNPYLLHQREFVVNPKQIFLIQAYSVYESIFPDIKELLHNSGYELTYFTERNGQVIFDDIWNLMNESQAVLVDFTLKKPNVYLEYGMALVLGKPIIAITQNLNDIPSDTPNLKCIEYEDRRGDKKLEDKLVSAIQQTILDFENIKKQGISIFDQNNHL